MPSFRFAIMPFFHPGCPAAGAGQRDRGLPGLPAYLLHKLEPSIKRTADGCQGERGSLETAVGSP
jgi:hypothetical protein